MCNFIFVFCLLLHHLLLFLGYISEIPLKYVYTIESSNFECSKVIKNLLGFLYFENVFHFYRNMRVNYRWCETVLDHARKKVRNMVNFPFKKLPIINKKNFILKVNLFYSYKLLVNP